MAVTTPSCQDQGSRFSLTEKRLMTSIWHWVDSRKRAAGTDADFEFDVGQTVHAQGNDALALYYTTSELDVAIAGQSADFSDYYTHAQNDSRYFPANADPANSEVFTLVHSVLTSRHAAACHLVSGTIAELEG